MPQHELTMERGQEWNSHLKRYRLSNGWFIDRDQYEKIQGKYTVWIPGAGPLVELADPPYRIAGCIGGAQTLKQAFEIAKRQYATA